VPHRKLPPEHWFAQAAHCFHTRKQLFSLVERVGAARRVSTMSKIWADDGVRLGLIGVALAAGMPNGPMFASIMAEQPAKLRKIRIG
jgi:hypothetical protein